MSIEYLNPEDRYDIEVFNRNFKELEDKINALEDANPSLKTPQEVYAETRPADWLPMPMPEDDEIYLLFHIPDGLSGLIAFYADCAGNYTVETGTVVNGTFVSQTNASLDSGENFEAELFADNYGELTSNGFKQVMLRVSGTDITYFDGTIANSKRPQRNSYNVVEFAGRLPNVNEMRIGSSSAYRTNLNLRYFALYGPNNITDGTNLLRKCESLIAVLALDTSKFITIGYICANCHNLMAMSPLYLPECEIANSAFEECYSLSGLKINGLAPIEAISMFARCLSLLHGPSIDTSNLELADSMYEECVSLQDIQQSSFPKASNLNSFCINCISLKTMTIDNSPLLVDTNGFVNGCTALRQLTVKNTPSLRYIQMIVGNSGVEEVEINSPNIEDISNAFYGCKELKKITFTHMGTALTNASAAFQSCTSLAKLLFDPTVTGWAGVAISLTYCSLSHQAIIDFFNSLPTITGAKAITLTWNPGVSDLTDTDKAIATQKGWTLTL